MNLKIRCIRVLDYESDLFTENKVYPLEVIPMTTSVLGMVSDDGFWLSVELDGNNTPYIPCFYSMFELVR